jgi:hypothetical protein
MKTPLDKPFVIEMYAYTFQGERSIAFALGAPWDELRAFYQGERIAGLKSFNIAVHERLNRQQVKCLCLNRNQISLYPSPVRLHQYLFGKWVSRWKRQWSFPAEAICFMATALDSLVHHLESETRPDQNDLIALRMDLCTSRSIIEDRCYGLAELALARRLEHFWQADWITPVTLQDLLAGGPDQTKPAERKSA